MCGPPTLGVIPRVGARRGRDVIYFRSFSSSGRGFSVGQSLARAGAALWSAAAARDPLHSHEALPAISAKGGKWCLNRVNGQPATASNAAISAAAVD
jgi:hypothetical protein